MKKKVWIVAGCVVLMAAREQGEDGPTAKRSEIMSGKKKTGGMT